MRRIIEYFTKEDQDKKLIRKMKEYEQKEKAKQQESKILGQKPVKGKTNKEKSTVQ
tara:strand:+ start:905 stop:1072 length:168 start_codon:yes stop_codon:yes gene_type:complete